MDAITLKKNKNFESLIEMGKYGHFPIFENEWLQDIDSDNSIIDPKEKVRAQKLVEGLIKHRSFERQKTVLFSMDKGDRKLIIQSFLKLVEGKILDSNMELQ